MTSTKIKRVFLSFIASIFLATSLLSAFAPLTTSAASNPGQVGGGCVGQGSSTGAKSPFQSTPKLCLGQDGQQQYYQFVVDFEVPVNSVSVTGKSEGSSPVSINFVKESSTRYVSTSPRNNDLGYQTGISTSSSTCNKSDGYKIIDVTAKANGQTQKLPSINLCSYTNINSSVIYTTANTITAEGSGGTSSPTSTGTLLSNLGIFRTDDLVPSGIKQGLLQQDAVGSIKLTGPTAKSGDNTSTWYTLNDGQLVIPGLATGTYSLSIVYNDKTAIAEGNPPGDPAWTQNGINITISNIFIKAGEEKWAPSGASKTNTIFYNAKGDVVTIPKAVAGDKKSTCVIDGVGWIVCSFTNFLANVTDGIYSLIENLLRVPVINTNTSDGTNGVYNTWVIMRNFANVGFVIGFLIIIFSQLTSVGISNYGVKKTLPRLIIAAILVNVSFWVSAIAVDLSNIAGTGLYEIMNNVRQSMNIGISGNWGNIIGGLMTGSLITVGVAGVTIGAAAAVLASGGGMALLFLAIPLVLSAVLAVLVAAFVLVARQALVVILIIISPLAFVALLLPNTEKLFNKWRSALVSLLLLFPIVSVVFGGAQIAGLAIMSTATSGTDPIATILPILIGQSVIVIPLFFIPMLITKFSGSNLSGLAATIMSKGKGLVGGASNAARKEGKGRFARSLNTMKYGEGAPRGIIGRSVRRFGRTYDQTKDQQSNADKFLSHERSKETRERLATDAAYATASAAGSVAGGKVLSLRAQSEGEAEELEEARKAVVQTNMSSDERQKLALTGSVTLSDGTTLTGDALQRAAIQEQLRAGSYGQQAAILRATDQDKEFGKKFGQTISGGVASNGLSSKDPALGGRRLEDLSQGNFNYESAVKQAITEGKYTAEAFAGMNDEARAQAIQIARTAEAEGDTSLITALQSAAAGIQDSVQIRGKISGNTTALEQVSSLLPSTPASGTTNGNGSNGFITPGDSDFRVR